MTLFEKCKQVSPLEAGFKTLNDLLAGLDKTGKRSVWGFSGWPFQDIQPRDPDALIYGGNRNLSFAINVALLNDTGKTLGTASITLNIAIPAPSPASGRIALPPVVSGTVIFRNVKAGDLTDTLTVRITSVNGAAADAAAERGYVRVVDLAVQRALAQQQRQREQAFLNSITYETRNNGIVITKYKGIGGAVVIPGRINNLPVTSIGENAFADNEGLRSITIGQGVEVKRAGRGNRDAVYDRLA